MSHAAVTVSRLAFLGLVALTCASVASAAPVDANHRFERIGYSVGNVARSLPVPGQMRAIVVTKNGEVHRVAGDRLVDEFLGSFPVSETCPGDGVLDAAWDIQTNAAIFVTYIAPGATRRFTVARLDITGNTVSAPQTLYSFPVPATAAGCTNLGGGTVMALDGRLLVGVGDMGNGPGAGQQSVVTGKILRFNATMPGGPAADNPSPTSPVYCLGVRNPTRMALDTMSGRVWFVDIGPASNDELNWMSGSSTNYAWPRASGDYNTLGFRDPATTWATAVTPTGVAVNRMGNFGAAWDGDVVVTAAAGTMYRVDPVDLVITPPQATRTTIFTPGTGDPNAFVSAYMGADGYAYVTTPSGEFFRLRNNNAPVQEPSDVASIVPTLVRKLSGGGLEIMTERETAVDKYGFYPGTTDNFYSHFDAGNPLLAPADCVTTTGATAGCVMPDTSTTSAWARIQLSPTQVNAMPADAYFVLSALSDRAESMVGISSQGADRPGGLQTFGCPCPTGVTVGPRVNNCGPDFTVAQGVEGRTGSVPNVFGPYVLPEQYECSVVMLDLSAEWCPPCRIMALDAESLYQQFKDRGFVMIHVLNERDPRGTGPCDVPCADRWTRDFGTTFPVLADITSQGWDNYNTLNGWPQSLLISRDGIVVRRFDGSQPRATLEAAIEAEVSR